MKDKIIEALKDQTKALEVIEIYNLLKLKETDEYNLLSDMLDTMQNEGEIYKTNKDKYILFENCPGVFRGRISINKKGFGFVILPEQDDLYIPEVNLNGAINNDFVVCEVTKNGLKPEGRIIKILKRDLKNIVGTMELGKKNKLIFVPDDESINLKFKIDEATTRNCVEGSKVCLSVGKNLGNNIYEAAIIKVLGHKNDPGMDIKSIAYK